jgi:hypothetical protein
MDRLDITEIFLKVALNTITFPLPKTMQKEYYMFEGINDLSISQTIEAYGAINFDMELDFEMKLSNSTHKMEV